MKVLICSTFLLLLTLTSCEKVRFDNYQIWSLKIETPQQLESLRELQINQYEISFWKMPDHLGQIIEVVVPPTELNAFKELVAQLEIKNKIFNANLQE